MMAGDLGWVGVQESCWRKGPWTAEEDRLLIEHVSQHGDGRWNSVAGRAGLRRNGKSCRLRWVNYLRPDLKRGQITPQEENIIVELHARWGNRWSAIARSLPGRTDNEIKNYWRTHFKNMKSLQKEKAKSQALRLQQQKQLLQQQQQQQQRQDREETEIKAIELQAEGAEYRGCFPPQIRPDMFIMNTADIEQYLAPMYQGEGPLITGSSEESIRWSGLWNLDYGDEDTMQNQIAYFYPESFI